MSHIELVHSLVETVRNVASMAQMDFFVMFQDQESNRRFAGTDDFVELFMRYDLLPHPSDIRLDPAVEPQLQETYICDIIPIDAESIDDKTDFVDEPLPQIQNTFSIGASNTNSPPPQLRTEKRTKRKTTTKTTSSKSSTPSSSQPPVPVNEEEPAAVENGERPKRERKRKGRRLAYVQNRTKNPTLRCKTCQKTFFSNFNMMRHVENVHLRIKPYICNVCEKGFRQKNSFQKHMKTHSHKRHKNNNDELALKKDTETLNAVYKLDEDQY